MHVFQNLLDTQHMRKLGDVARDNALPRARSDVAHLGVFGDLQSAQHGQHTTTAGMPRQHGQWQPEHSLAFGGLRCDDSRLGG